MTKEMKATDQRAEQAALAAAYETMRARDERAEAENARLREENRLLRTDPCAVMGHICTGSVTINIHDYVCSRCRRHIVLGQPRSEPWVIKVDDK